MVNARPLFALQPLAMNTIVHENTLIIRYCNYPIGGYLLFDSTQCVRVHLHCADAFVLPKYTTHNDTAISCIIASQITFDGALLYCMPIIPGKCFHSMLLS